MLIRPAMLSAPTTFITYIAVRRFHYRVAYGIRMHLPEGIVSGLGSIRGTQNVDAQKKALDEVLNAIAISDRKLKTLVILRTEYLRQTLDFGRTRNKKRQYGQTLSELKTDEELFEKTPILFDLYGCGIRMADSDDERHELTLIEKQLNDEFWKRPSQFEQDLCPDIVL